MLGKSFVFGSLVAFSLLNNVAATTTEELFVMGLGTTIPPNARKGNVGLGDYGGLNPNAVSHLPEKDTKVKLSDQPNRLVSYYKKKRIRMQRTMFMVSTKTRKLSSLRSGI